MASKKRPSNKQRGNKEINYAGLDPKLMGELANKIPKNPRTGRVDMEDIIRFMSEHPEEMENLLAATAGADLLGQNVDLSEFNFTSLAPTIKHESFWVLQLEPFGMVDSSGRTMESGSSGRSTDSLRPSFMLYCYDDLNRHRAMQECAGLPTSNVVLQIIKRAIAKPIPPLSPELPWFFLLSTKLQQHVTELKPFLDSLPSPFHWRVETREEADALSENIFKGNEEGVDQSLKSANMNKSLGNSAYANRDRGGALKAYKDAIEDVFDALSQKPGTEEEKKAKKLLAICYANRSATYLIPGSGADAKKALQDGKLAEEADSGYAKAYLRQANAYQLLKDSDAAKDIVARALRRQDLENDNGLVDCLINLYTDGKGLPNDEGIFKNWTLNILSNDKKSSERLSGIQGEWTRRLDVQLAKWK